MEVMAIIPARAGSKGVAGKNIRLLGGYPLIAWSIAAAKMADRITRVVVSTDSREYAAIAIHYGAETPFLRPAEFATDTSLDIDFLLHVLDWLREHENYFPDLLVHLRPTSPIRDPKVLDQAIELMMGHPEATSALSIYPVEYPPCKFLKMDHRGYLVSYMDGVDVNIPRQQCPQAYQGAGYVDVLRAASVWGSKNQLGSKILPFITHDPGDIDEEKDFQFTEVALSMAAPSLLSYLEKIGPLRVGKNNL